MAKFGAKHPCFAPIATEPDNAAPTYGVGAEIGKLVAANLTVNLASGELFADDILAEQLSEFASGTLVMETDDMVAEIAGMVYGATVNGNRVTYNKGDTAPLGGLGYYKVMMRNGVKYYEGYYYPKVRAALGNDNAQTRGNSITFSTTSTTFTVFAPNAGDWRETETFTTEEAAKLWIENKLGLATAYEINVATSGEGTVSPLGRTMVAAGGSFVLNVGADITKLYDNGVDVTSSIDAGDRYTLTTMDADHDIVAVFTGE